LEETIFWARNFFGGDYFSGETIFRARLFFGRDYFSGQTIFWVRLFFGQDYFLAKLVGCPFSSFLSPDHCTALYCTLKSADSLTRSQTHSLTHGTSNFILFRLSCQYDNSFPGQDKWGKPAKFRGCRKSLNLF
jgi:hypothetical protein